MTNKEITAKYNLLTGKNIKPGSYSIAVLTQMVEAIEATKAAEDKPLPSASSPSEPRKQTKKPKPTAVVPVGSSDTFTLAGLCRELGISPKQARARYRKHDNDGQRTQYSFANTKEERARVKAIILPK